MFSISSGIVEVGRLDGLAPVVEADRRVVVGLVDVATVHDQTLRADLRRGVDVLLRAACG
ncbi:MAG: hypothetical protein QM779_05870 [Propionicimonas sp.]|uniref:hypothetical protein n=1 Tax=Propionicimonas sp. TaxID=1955623 RepID=UPI003D097F08